MLHRAGGWSDNAGDAVAMKAETMVKRAGKALKPGTSVLGAFTLIELLVVIAIIAILVGITMPALGNARETSRRVKCTANLRAHGTALQIYMNESKDLLPVTRVLFDPNFDPASAQPNEDPHILNVLVKYMGIDLPTVDAAVPSPMLFTGVSDSLVCPSDRHGKDAQTGFAPLWRSLAWSYSYFPGELATATEMLTVPSDLRQASITKTYEQVRWKDLPVVFDYDDLHPIRRGTGTVPRNALYFGDWRADWAADLTRYQNRAMRADQVWRDLVFDLTRFGGFRLPN